MTLVKTESDRTDKRGRPYIDFYLAWRYQDKVYSVRISPCFYRDINMLFTEAVNVPKGEPFEKYL